MTGIDEDDDDNVDDSDEDLLVYSYYWITQ
jgi:hypothetical protein